MIGQRNLRERIDNMIQNECFPRFMIITGEPGSGKKTLVNYITSQLGDATCKLEDNKIADVREMIKQSYDNAYTISFVLADADDMSSAAQNALLKIVEEPPKNTYYIMTLQDINNTLPTIKSRAYVLRMQPYTKGQITEYLYQMYEEENELYADICTTPGEVNALHSIGIDKFVDFVEKVVDNLGTVSTGNLLKVGQSIKLTSSENDTGYDLNLFLNTFMWQCFQYRNDTMYLQMLINTSHRMQKLQIKGVNKQMWFNDWILRMREIYGAHRTKKQNKDK